MISASRHLLLLLVCVCLTGCGYKVVNWSSANYKTMAIMPVRGMAEASVMRLRLRDALIERCLSSSGLTPKDDDGDLVLKSNIISYRETVIATDVDGRTRRLQFTIRMKFELTDRSGETLWSLDNYNYSDQYGISTTQEQYRDESVYTRDQAMRSIADLVITNISLIIAEREPRHE